MAKKIIADPRPALHQQLREVLALLGALDSHLMAIEGGEPLNEVYLPDLVEMAQRQMGAALDQLEAMA